MINSLSFYPKAGRIGKAPTPKRVGSDPPKNDQSCCGTEGKDSANVLRPFTNKEKKSQLESHFFYAQM
ncbi:hypothetical protein GQ457_02G039850 [Hibiscus cannabinus]